MSRNNDDKQIRVNNCRGLWYNSLEVALVPTLKFKGVPMDDSFEPLSEPRVPSSSEATHSEERVSTLSEQNADDSPIGYVVYPILRNVSATFSYIGRIQPLPIPELDFED